MRLNCMGVFFHSDKKTLTRQAPSGRVDSSYVTTSAI
jgi:hypothetical protein